MKLQIILFNDCSVRDNWLYDRYRDAEQHVIIASICGIDLRVVIPPMLKSRCIHRHRKSTSLGDCSERQTRMIETTAYVVADDNS